MKAMILAAGLGTRLRPLTNDRPKALVEVAGHALLELTLMRLRAAEVHEVIINTHHYADMILQYLEDNRNFDMRIEISREEVLLDTGGGLKKAAWFFRERPEDSSTPFLVHNVDVMSTIDLGRMVRFHLKHDALVTMAVQHRKTSRPLIFDEKGLFRGRYRENGATEATNTADENGPSVGSSQQWQRAAFSGIHILSPRIFSRITEDGVFSIIDSYIRLASQGERIMAFDADEYYWRDLGRPENVVQAARDIENGNYPGQ